jgi:hypothetical protein
MVIRHKVIPDSRRQISFISPLPSTLPTAAARRETSHCTSSSFLMAVRRFRGISIEDARIKQAVDRESIFTTLASDPSCVKGQTPEKRLFL